MPNAANPRTDGIALLADLAELGARVTEAMATAVRNPEVLTNATTQILILLRTHGPSRPSDLASHLGVSRPQITKLVGQLEEHELVERRHDIHIRSTCRHGRADRRWRRAFSTLRTRLWSKVSATSPQCKRSLPNSSSVPDAELRNHRRR